MMIIIWHNFFFKPCHAFVKVVVVLCCDGQQTTRYNILNPAAVKLKYAIFIEARLRKKKNFMRAHIRERAYETTDQEWTHTHQQSS